MPSLQTLDIAGNAIGNDGLKSFAITAAASGESAFPCSSTLLRIDFCDNNVGWEGVKCLLKTMAEKNVLPRLEVLQLKDNKEIGDVGISHIVDALEKGAGPKLRKLDFSKMGMTDEGAKVVGAALAG